MQQNSSYIEQVSLSPLQDEAQELMNSLFSGVEQALSIDINSGIDLMPDDIANYDLESSFYQSGNSKLGSAIALVMPKDRNITTQSIKISPRSNISTIKSTIAAPSPADQSSSNQEALGLIDSILLGSAFTSAIFAVILGLINLKTSAPLPQTQVQQVYDPSTPVADNLRRSLWEIKPTNTPTTGNQTSGSSPVIDITTPTVKPIYIPIYQPPTPTTSSNPVSSPQPPIAPVQKPVAKALPKGSYTLIGVLDLGDRSSAIFDVNGSVQSIKIGSVLGESGWVVSRIAQEKVILKRNNEDTTVTVGQKF